MTSTAKPDYWSLLGLEPGSNTEQLKSAFRREARRWHPDLNGNDISAEERFKLVNEAYEVLSDPQKRSEWEKLNRVYLKNKDPFDNKFPTFEEYLNVVLGLSSVTSTNKEEVFDQDIDSIPTNTYRNQYPTTVEQSPPPVKAFDDVETTVDLTPDEALYGTKIEIELSDLTLVLIQTPPFAGDGWRLRLEGVAKGGRDHFLQLRVRTNEGLRIDGLRVLYRLDLFPPDAVLGCSVDIPTLSGSVTLQVPPLSSSGRMLRLRGRGLEHEGIKGDQLVEICIVIPTEINDSENALYYRLQELLQESE